MDPAASFGKTDPADCDREPIHVPGSIQPHGCLVVLHPETLAVIQQAGDFAGILGVVPDTRAGTPLAELIGSDAAAAIVALIRRQRPGPPPASLHQHGFRRGDRNVNAVIHVSEGLPVIEFEAAGPSGVRATGMLMTLQRMLARLEDAASMRDFAQTAVEQIRAVTGFDRVMLYTFLANGSGRVIAEDREPELESYLDLHYPASDIPRQARELYLKNRLRQIPDVNYVALPVAPEINPVTNRPLDMSFCHLRSVSPVHIQYLRNMGVGASMSISVIRDASLWGLIACHHRRPHYLSGEERAACELFGQVFSSQLGARERAAADQQSVNQKTVQSRLMSRLLKGDDLSGSLIGCDPHLLDYIEADGAAVWIEGKYAELGRTPGEGNVRSIVEWRNAEPDEGVFATHHLARAFPPAKAFAADAAGLLALSVSRTPRDYVFWFRREVTETITWAGDPGKSVEPPTPGGRLSPRTSFAAWRETVRFQSRPWKPVEIEAAHSLRLSLLEIVLRRIDEVARERARNQERQGLLIAELDHRVKNTLATIQSIMRFSRGTSDTLDSYVANLERRIKAMARAHDLVSRAREQAAELRQIIGEQVNAYRGGPRANVVLTGPDLTLKPRAALSIGMVIQELATNAAKYGSLSVDGGRLDVAWMLDRTAAAPALALSWVERGGPEVTEPTRTGFGRQVIERLLTRELGGRASLTFDPAGLRCDLHLPLDPVLAGDEPSRDPSAAGGANIGRQVLVVADSVITAADLQEKLRAGGLEVLGPTGNIAEALWWARVAAVDAAVLDFGSGDTGVLAVADVLSTRNVPFIILGGYERKEVLPDRYVGRPFLARPYGQADLTRMLTAAMHDTGGGHKR